MPVDAPILKQREGWLWIHLNLADVRTAKAIRAIDLPEPAVAILSSRDDHQQLHASEHCVCGVFSDLSRTLAGVGDDFAQLHFAMTERMLVTGRYRALAAAETVRTVLEHNQIRVTSPAKLVEYIVGRIADGVDRVVRNLETEIDEIEDGITRMATHAQRADLRRLRRISVKLHRQTSEMRGLFNRLDREDVDLLAPPITLDTSKLAQRLDALDHDIVEIRDRARLLQDEIASATAEDSNNALKTLTIITTLILPPSLISGYFGINTKGLPFGETPDGSIWVLGLMACSALITYIVMKRMRVI